MKRQRMKVQPKLTQQEIIDLLIERLAAALQSDYYGDWTYSTFDIPAKNQETLDKMVKRGLLVENPGHYYELSPAQVKKHEAIIRFKAMGLACREAMFKWSLAADDKSASERWSAGKWLGTVIGRSHWSHTPNDFHFFEYDFQVNGEVYRRVRPIAGFNMIDDRVWHEHDLQVIDHKLARCEIAHIPSIEIYAY